MRSMLVLAIAVALCGCSNEGSSGSGSGTTESARTRPLTAAQQAKVDKAVAVNAALQAGSQDPDAILRANGLTEQQFDDLLVEIAADDAMSAAYTARTGP